MGNASEASLSTKSIEDKTLEELVRAVTARMNSVLLGLAEHGELSQGDLAKAIGSNATALSNLLAKFERLSIKLLIVRNVGRYRYYKLSEEGEAYLAATGQLTVPKTDSEPEGRDAALFQEAKQVVDDLKRICGEKWKRSFNKTMMKLLQGKGNALPQQGEELVYRYLRCVELLTMRNGYAALNEALKELPDEVLRDDVEEFMDYFQHFIYLLNLLEQGRDPTGVYMLVKAAFLNEAGKSKDQYIEEIGWDHSSYTKLRTQAQELKSCVSGYSEEEISRYFSVLLPNQIPLGLYIARCICGGRNQETVGKP